MIVGVMTSMFVGPRAALCEWTRGGEHADHYDAGVTEEGCRGAGRCGYIRSLREGAQGFGTLLQSFDAKPYLGQRLRLRAVARGQGIEKWAGVWMRVDGSDNLPLAFDNMQDRALEGSEDWRDIEIVLDVSAEAASIWFGCLLVGDGQVWFDDFDFDVVGRDVATTDVMIRPKAPGNLDFEEE